MVKTRLQRANGASDELVEVKAKLAGAVSDHIFLFAVFIDSYAGILS